MDTRRLAAFIKVVDVGSVTRAASLLHIAQPALSQQMVALEGEFRQKLLIRSPRGVSLTPAGRALYHHAHIMLRQEAEARRSVSQPELVVSGEVCVGLAPSSSATSLALPLLRKVREKYPNVILHIREHFGPALTELIMKDAMHVAVLYDVGPIRGLSFETIATEQWCVVGLEEFFPIGNDAIPLAALADREMFLPVRSTYPRARIEKACRDCGFSPHIIAELESLSTLGEALAEGLGITILPLPVALELQRVFPVTVRTLTEPEIIAPISLCLKDDATHSVAATAVIEILREETMNLHGASAT
ncbi:LysR substrate-binding domain-containing protein [Gluconobacter cerinus]|uniref:LysR substrate-binding domain-containing protein n=1 Tax=Gluconobacter cerinus TaxID=38307 RepID=UPI001C04089F|nr:LysR substrate-binding domain-containing protein [Gluconobacter cerinus]